MVVLLHVVGEFGELLRGHAQGFGGVRAHRWDDLLVEIFDEFGDLFFQALGSVADGLADTCRSVFDLAVEVVHGAPRDDWA